MFISFNDVTFQNFLNFTFCKKVEEQGGANREWERSLLVLYQQYGLLCLKVWDLGSDHVGPNPGGARLEGPQLGKITYLSLWLSFPK